ncbi:uncharacterized protein LOC111623327 [Centruroides sculpturatus]|uniref:uncharacterized protein LOC111623327 n=1 Tax=Centruroides sculpturatus TaxID=218467 RepID=UPI000C6E02D7|nr:uncharacterized protein LOC111623327 [Centruroides sculpturatus]
MKYFLRIVIVYISCNIVYNSEDCLSNFQNCIIKNVNIIKDLLNCTLFSWDLKKYCLPQESDSCYESISNYTNELLSILNIFEQLMLTNIKRARDKLQCLQFIGVILERNFIVCEHDKRMTPFCDFMKIIGLLD